MMNKYIRNIIIAILTFSISLSYVMPTLAEEVYSGTFGSLNWNLNATTGLMTISGNGEMQYVGSSSSPWYDYIDSIKSVVVENGVTSVANFDHCKNLTSVKLADSVKTVQNHAFSWCASLTDVDLGNSVEKIRGSFMYDTSLKKITIPDSCVYMYGGTFEGCSSLTDVSLPDSMTGIGCFAFYGCTSLADIKLPSSLEYIGRETFTGCISLTELTIPASVVEICGYQDPESNTFSEGKAFLDCVSLKTITVLGENTTIWEDDAAIPSGVQLNVLYNSKAKEYAQAHSIQYSYVCVDGSQSHNYEITTTATCTEDGIATSTCSLCGYYFDEAQTATGHNYTDTIVAPTTTGKGYTIFTCENCGHKYIDNYVDSLVEETTSEEPNTENTDTEEPNTNEDLPQETTENTLTETKQEDILKKNEEFTTKYKNFRGVGGYKCAKIAWKPRKDIDGYEVFLGTSNKKLNLICDMPKEKSDFFIVQDLSPNTVYYACIIAYKKTDNEKAYAKKSEIIKILVK